MDFAEVLTKSGKIIWKHKILWVFGFFAGCGRGGGGGGGSNSSVQFSGGSRELPSQLEGFVSYLESFGEWLSSNLWVLVVLALVVLLLTALSIFLSTVGRIGLIQGAIQADRGVELLAFGDLFRSSLPFFWRVFGLGLLVGLVLLAVFLVLFFPLAFLGMLTMGVGFLLLFPLLCVLIPAFWAVGILLEQAYVAIVLEDLGALAGLRRGWEVVRANLGPVLLMGLLLIIGAGVVGFLAGLPIFLAVIPIIFGVALGDQAAFGGSLLVAGICVAAYLPVLLVLQSVLYAYIQSAWTLTYARLTGHGSAPPVQAEPRNA
jgi:hypothetical protein